MVHMGTPRTKVKGLEQMEQERLLLRVTEAADALGISRAKAYELVAARVIPVVRLGRATRVPVDGLRRWVDEQSQQPEMTVIEVRPRPTAD
jgi:excisionase family DNA binding protein